MPVFRRSCGSKKIIQIFPFGDVIRFERISLGVSRKNSNEGSAAYASNLPMEEDDNEEERQGGFKGAGRDEEKQTKDC